MISKCVAGSVAAERLTPSRYLVFASSIVLYCFFELDEKKRLLHCCCAGHGRDRICFVGMCDVKLLLCETGRLAQRERLCIERCIVERGADIDLLLYLTFAAIIVQRQLDAAFEARAAIHHQGLILPRTKTCMTLAISSLQVFTFGTTLLSTQVCSWI